MSTDIEILYKDKDIAVIKKPVGMPSQKDPTGDADALSGTSAILASSGECPELFLIHRLDRGVGGLLVFARNKKTAAALSALVAERKMKKEYLAVARGEVSGGEYRDYLYKDAKQGKSFVTDRMRKGVKEAVLYAEPIETGTAGSGIATLVHISLGTGRHHQIRVQLSSRKNPLIGDKKYGDSDRIAHTPSLFAAKLSFSLFGREYSFEALPDGSAYPWREFDYFKEKEDIKP